MNYTLHQLRIFLEVVSSASITKAAEAMHLTQPAVSIQLKNLQDQFKVPLTEVVGRKLHVTAFGHEFAQAAHRIIAEVDAINERMLAFTGHLGGKLRISSVSTGKYVMPYFLSDFLAKYNGVELLLDVTNKSQVVKHLEENSIDFALVSVLPEHLAVERIELLQNRLFLVSRPEMAERISDTSLDVLTQLPLIFREKGSGTRYVMEQHCRQHGVPITNKMELTSNEAVKQAVLAGLGCSVMPLIGIGPELQGGDLRIIPLKGLPIVSNWNLIWLTGKKLSPVAQAFAEFVRSERNEIIARSFSWYNNY